MLKLLGNFIRFSAIATLGEAVALSEVVGLPLDALEQFVELVLQGAAVGQLKGLRAGEYHKTDKVLPVVYVRPSNTSIIADITCSQPSPSACGTRKVLTWWILRVEGARDWTC